MTSNSREPYSWASGPGQHQNEQTFMGSVCTEDRGLTQFSCWFRHTVTGDVRGRIDFVIVLGSAALLWRRGYSYNPDQS